MTKQLTREEWLIRATKRLTPWINDCDNGVEYELPLISVGWPKGSRGRGKAIGQCWDKSASGDKTRAHIFIAPTLDDPVEVVSTLLHELVHASVGTECGHKGPFRLLALELGFMEPMTQTPMSDPLRERIVALLDKLPEFPHVKLNDSAIKKQTTRMLKVECPACGCIARMTAKWLDEVGPPTCGCGVDMEIAQ